MDTVRTIFISGTIGTFVVNIIFFIERMTRMGFFEAVGRSVFALTLGITLNFVTLALGVGIYELCRKR